MVEAKLTDESYLYQGAMMYSHGHEQRRVFGVIFESA
jgi:hypothetical protein